MSSGEMKLPALEQEAFVLDPNLERILRWQWRVDPPWILRYLKEEIVREIYGAMLHGRAELAKLEVQAKQAEAKMYEEIARIATPKAR